VTVSVFAAGAPLSTASLTLAGATSSFRCTEALGSTCVLLGQAATYAFDVSAPGYQTVRRRVVVPAAASAGCGCAAVTTQHLDVALSPVP
jgi:hypothetical protein